MRIILVIAFVPGCFVGSLSIYKSDPGYSQVADLPGITMPELRVTVTKQLDDLLDMVVESGIFASKADALRAATIYFLKDLGWLERPAKTKLK